MEPILHTKYLVKVILVTKSYQKTHFTIRHPENAICLSGIAVTTTSQEPSILKDGAKPISDNAGVLSLAIPNKGDVFYSEDVKVGRLDYRDKIEQLLNPVFLPKKFQYAGKRLAYFETKIPITDAMMEGYYEDNFITTAISGVVSPKGEGGVTPLGGPVKISSAGYKVTLYLRYDLKEKEIIEEPKPCK